MKIDELVSVLFPKKALTDEDFLKIEKKLKCEIPQSVKVFYRQCNGGDTEDYDTGNELYLKLDDKDVPIMQFLSFLYAGSSRFTAERSTLNARKTGCISPEELIFAITNDDQSRLCIDTKTGAVLLHRMGEWSKEHESYLFGEAESLCGSFEEFIDRLRVKCVEESEEEETKAQESLEITDAAEPLTKQELDEFEKEMQVTLPAAMRSFYLKNNGGMPNLFLFTPQNEEYDDVEIQQFLAIKHTCEDVDTIEARTRYEREDKQLPEHLLPFAIDSGDNLFVLDCRSKAIYYLPTDEWDYDLSADENIEELAFKVARSFNYFITNLWSDED